MSEENKQRPKEYQKCYSKANKSTTKNIFFFSLHCIKLENQVLIFDKQCINKNTFHKDESIDKVETRRIVLSKKDLYGK